MKSPNRYSRTTQKPYFEAFDEFESVIRYHAVGALPQKRDREERQKVLLKCRHVGHEMHEMVLRTN